MKEGRDTHAPFDQDIEKHGAFQYTGGERLSARMANERYTRCILGALDFAGKTVVDVGAGDGAYTAELAQQSGAGHVLGIEPSPKAVERARQAFANVPGLDFRVGTSATLLEEGRRFDIAVYRGVLHHVAEPEAEVAQALRLADTAVFLEPNGLNLLMKLVENCSAYHREHQEQSFAPRTVKRWIMQAGGMPHHFQFFGLVPYFCPGAVARAGRLFEPLVEAVPGVRAAVCGQYLLTAVSGQYVLSAEPSLSPPVSGL